MTAVEVFGGSVTALKIPICTLMDSASPLQTSDCCSATAMVCIAAVHSHNYYKLACMNLSWMISEIHLWLAWWAVKTGQSVVVPWRVPVMVEACLACGMVDHTEMCDVHRHPFK